MDRPAVLVFLFCLLCATRAQADFAQREVTILANEKVYKIANALIDGADLLIPYAKVQEVTGFEVKPQGMCAGTVSCFPAEASWTVKRDGTSYFNLTQFAKKMNQVYAVDAEQNVWSFTPVPHPHTAPIITGAAPDFALPDRNGKIVRLSDFRGKKVVLVTWASWCGCRLDIGGWQKVYDELKDKGLEIISIAEDTGGTAVAEPWFKRGNATMTGLIDVNHTVSSLFQMVNVPAGVWIDETGKIARPAEVAYSQKMKNLPGSPGDPRYVQGVRDWVEKGKKSEYVINDKNLKERLALRAPKLRMADAEFKLATYFKAQGKPDLAAKHFHEAQQLSPDNWNYHRQEWSFEPATAITKWLAKVRQLNGKPYYDPVEFPGATSPAQR